MGIHLWFWLFLGAVISGSLYALAKWCSQFRSRTLDEVLPFLRQINHPELEEFFDPVKEREALRFCGNKRRARRARLDLAREYLRRMFHNSMVVFQWANPEYACMRKEPEAFDALTKARITELRQASMLFYNVAFFVLAEMNFWLLISSLRWLPLPVPSAAELRRYASLDLLGAYQRVKTAAAELASFFGEDEARLILEIM